ncbi:MAG: aminoacyl-tRNA hydrolase [Alphaproteobacteria bacterium]|nr:aminoacyl-tRNA hydrolase [Alphaproteobacteria bacterium]
MRLLVGLGNPGPRYARQRHNIGFMVVEAIAARHGFGPWRARAKFAAELAEGALDGEPALLIKPTTFMNESGQSVGALMHFHKLEPAQIYVFHDELDLAPGKMRIKLGGGTAGHNGLRSIEAHIGEAFWRVRLGIGHPGDRDLVTHYVLSDFWLEDRLWLEPLIEALAIEAPLLLKSDDGSAYMSRVAHRLAPARPAKDKPSEPPAGSTGKRSGPDDR